MNGFAILSATAIGLLLLADAIPHIAHDVYEIQNPCPTAAC